MIADVDQAAGSPLGFLNPEIYKASTATPGGVQRYPAAFAAELGSGDPGRLREHGQQRGRVPRQRQGNQLCGSGDLLRRNGQLRDAQRDPDHRTRFRRPHRNRIRRQQIHRRPVEVLEPHGGGDTSLVSPPPPGDQRPGPPVPRRTGQVSTGMIRASTSRPSSMRSTPMVPCGWRRRSVGDPGLKMRMPASVWSIGMCE